MLLIVHIYLVHTVSNQQILLNQVQQTVTQAQAFQGNLKQLAVRIYQDSQKTQDASLKDLMARQQITFTPAPQSTNSTESPAAPSH